MNFPLTSNVPIPSRPNHKGAPRKYPLDEMAVGDSFFVPKSQNALSGSITGAQKRTGFRFTARSVTEGDVQGTRVWRTQ